MINTATSIFNFMCTYRDSNESAALSQDIRQYSFNNLREKVLSLASRLSAEGIKKGDIIASPLPNIIQNVILVYAAGLVGATVFEMHPKIGDEHFKKELLITKPKLVFLSEVNYTRLKKYKG